MEGTHERRRGSGTWRKSRSQERKPPFLLLLFSLIFYILFPIVPLLSSLSLDTFGECWISWSFQAATCQLTFSVRELGSFWTLSALSYHFGNFLKILYTQIGNKCHSTFICCFVRRDLWGFSEMWTMYFCNFFQTESDKRPCVRCNIGSAVDCRFFQEDFNSKRWFRVWTKVCNVLWDRLCNYGGEGSVCTVVLKRERVMLIVEDIMRAIHPGMSKSCVSHLL